MGPREFIDYGFALFILLVDILLVIGISCIIISIFTSEEK